MTTTVSAHRTRIIAVLTVLAVVFSAFGTVATSSPARAAETGSVSGIVTGPTGLPMAEVEVRVHRIQMVDGTRYWRYVDETTTDALGVYTFVGLAPDAYTLEVLTSTGELRADGQVIGEWWHDQPDERSATAFEIAEGDTLIDMNFQVDVKATVSGRVTDPDGSGVTLASVSLMRWTEVDGDGYWDAVSTGNADNNGNYTAMASQAGRYTLRVETSRSSGMLGAWWGGAASAESATTFDLEPGDVLSDMDIALDAGGVIEGTVTRADTGAPVPTVFVRLSKLVTHSTGSSWQAISPPEVTGQSGTFRAIGLETGTYRVEFDPHNPYLLGQWWPDAAAAADAQVIDVVAGETTSSIDAALAVGASISGTVSHTGGGAHAYGSVDLYRWADEPQARWVSASSTMSDQNGHYAFVGLREGTYTLRFLAGQTGLPSEWWNNQRGAESAQALVVEPGEAVTDIDAELGYADALVSAEPTIDGSLVVGQIVTAQPGDWAEGTSFTYQWAADGVPLEGETSATLTITQALTAQRVSVAVTGTKLGYTPVTRESAASVPVSGGALATTVPTIAGTVAVGSVLTAGVSGWTPDTTFTYRWLADGATISGATSSKLTLTSALQGKRISVAVTGQREFYVSASKTSAQTARVILAGTPTVSGSAIVGSTLTAKAGTWTSSTALKYQWYGNGSAISGATASTYKISSYRSGQKITVAVTGSKSGYATVTKSSASTSYVMRPSTPTISGTLAYGSTVTAKPNTWTTGTTFSYQWYANGVAISGATKSTFKIGSSQKAKQLSVKVTGRKSGHPTVAKTSAKSAKVATAATPTISGTRAVGYTLTANRGTWTSSTTFSYQWYANGTAISGATKSTLKLGSSQASKQITVKVTGRKSGYATVAKTSSATTRVMKPGTPSISGSPTVTRTLTAQTGSWTTGTTFRYQWYVGSTAISGATKSTLKVSSSWAGKTIKVKVTGSRSGYQTASKLSAATRTVGYPSVTAPSSEWNCPSWAPIKGNADSMIYHLKGQRYYNATKPEECFRTETAAVNAGYRKAKV
ncbi:carboxypeptidase regulatory-like domain-containing protein [Microbacterium sp. C7(2022)]|uniref:sunset domain-containing protein n=1 Tax=Microbacterium sp. C7(2022) TaxID=2992759 RepID=UPI00237A5E1C|nr:carboxypeptidase regulatory-like domain-containing protein [Microbacterium sp. C7(2022)]MDE0547460.1 carboxypeptidase-like regulatory domain-containing protein [Microbacterium sp. C7(2022)]